MSTALPALLLEAFAEGAGAGNGAAVVRLPGAVEDGWMQSVAGSLRQSETAFLLPSEAGWRLRWFTPSCEVPLCGHATLAALLALGHWGLVKAGEAVRFHSRGGLLRACLLASPTGGAPGRGWIELPGTALQPAPAPRALGPILRARLGEEGEAFWRSGLGYAVSLVSMAAPLVRLEGLGAELPDEVRDGLVVMQACDATVERPTVAGEAADYRLRFFAPGLGIPEDPVTGSAHALVAPWWMERLRRRRVVGWQCSDRPGGMVCEAGSSAKIRLTGSGHLLWDGTLYAAPRICEAGSSAAQSWRRLEGGD